MTAPAPLQAFLGGIGLAIPVQDLLTLNGSIFGISGFFHRAALGSSEAIASLAGLMLGGFAIGFLRSSHPEIVDPNLSTMILSGLLVGAGTKVCIIPLLLCRSLLIECTIDG